MAVLVTNNNLKVHNHLTRSLERILEEANHCGELKLSNRKLKDFPKVKEKYNLSDTVIADLSKNRFNELPDDITGFHYLEYLNCYHNAIRFIPDSIISLQCLSYLDLSRNQISNLPRELCQLPIEILLLSNNCLSSLPDDLWKMSKLTELDASCNKITHFPPRMGELKSLMALELRNNLLLVVPIEITFLRLTRLDLRANRISTLPVEIREMDTLIDLFVDDNPLTNPPAKLCKRGRIHIFKYLDTEAMKIACKSGGICASGTLGRRSKKGQSGNSPSPATPNLINNLKQKRQNIDSGYSTSSDCYEKRWSQEMTGDEKRWPPSTPILERTRSTSSTPSTLSSAPLDGSDEDNTKNEQHKNIINSSSDNSTINNGLEDKFKPLQHIQTYREYKEALKLQRAHDMPSLYRTRDVDDQLSYKTEPNTPAHQPIASTVQSMITSKSDPTPLNSAFNNTKMNMLQMEDMHQNISGKKPIQMVQPSRNISFSPPTNKHSFTNGNATEDVKSRLIHDYIKPKSPIKPSSHSSMPRHGVNDEPLSIAAGGKTYPNQRVPLKLAPEEGCVNGNILLVKTMVQNNQAMKTAQRNVISWNLDSNSRSNEKMSFTMRREIDKAREESDLINQLRNIIETRLKMIIPEEDLASALTDGVVLCHLANHIKPRSVASIHVPSPAVPKLTMARCRRNVDNFIEACRKIGVDENLVCCAADVLEGKGLVQIAITVTELLRFHSPRSPIQTGIASIVNSGRYT